MEVLVTGDGRARYWSSSSGDRAGAYHVVSAWVWRIKIPCEDAAKNDSYWTVALRNQTCEALSCWMREREATPAYDGTDKLWLNREGNPFNSKSLNYHFQKLLDLANIDDTNRRLVWYSIRHSVGNYMTEEGELDETKEQLRHRSLESTLQYTNPSTERRRKTLNKIG